MLKGLAGAVWREGKGNRAGNAALGEKGGNLLPQSPRGTSQAGISPLGRGTLLPFGHSRDTNPAAARGALCAALARGLERVCVLFGA